MNYSTLINHAPAVQVICSTLLNAKRRPLFGAKWTRPDCFNIDRIVFILGYSRNSTAPSGFRAETRTFVLVVLARNTRMNERKRDERLVFAYISPWGYSHTLFQVNFCLVFSPVMPHHQGNGIFDADGCHLHRVPSNSLFYVAFSAHSPPKTCLSRIRVLGDNKGK